MKPASREGKRGPTRHITTKATPDEKRHYSESSNWADRDLTIASSRSLGPKGLFSSYRQTGKPRFDNPPDCVILVRFPKTTQWEATAFEVAVRTNEEIWHRKQVSIMKRLPNRWKRALIRSKRRFRSSKRSNSPNSTK